MTWALIALLGYFFNAVSAVFDKYLLSDRIPTPAVYAFFVSMFSLFAMSFIPFGAHMLGVGTTLTLFLSGIAFVYGLVAFYAAVKQHEVSRVSPLVGTIVSLVAFSAVFLPGMTGEGHIGPWYLMALVFLIGGGLLISFDLPLRRGEHISRYVFLAGILMGLSLLFLKRGFDQSDYVNGIVWSRLGMVLAGLSLFLVPVFRSQIVAQFRGFHHRSSRAASTGGLFLVNKVVAAIGLMLISYATDMGSVSFVQALSGMQYVFLLLMMIPLSLRHPALFGEKLYFWDWFQKAIAIIIIGFGLWLASLSGVPLLV